VIPGLGVAAEVAAVVAAVEAEAAVGVEQEVAEVAVVEVAVVGGQEAAEVEVVLEAAEAVEQAGVVVEAPAAAGVPEQAQVVVTAEVEEEALPRPEQGPFPEMCGLPETPRPAGAWHPREHSPSASRPLYLLSG
jgi:hypothetical protein